MNAKSNRKGGGRSGSSKQRRPYSTIELKATEVPGKEEPSKTGDRKPAEGTAKTQGSTTKTSAEAKPTATSAATSSVKSTRVSPPPSPSSLRSKISNAGAAVPVMEAATSSKPGDDEHAATTASARSSSSAGSAGRARSSKAGSGKAPSRPARSGGGGFFSHMTAGILGALLALFGASYANKHANIPGLSAILPTTAPSASLPKTADRRIAALEKALATKASRNGNRAQLSKKLAIAEARLAKLENLAKSLAALRATQAKLQEQAGALQQKLAKSSSAITANTNGRIAQLEQTLAALGAAAKNDPKNAGRIPQLAAMSGRLNDLETAMATRIDGLRKDIKQEIDARLSSTTQASEAAKSGTQRLDRDVNELRSSTAKLDQRLVELDAASKQTRESLRVVQETTGSLKASVEKLTGDIAAKFKATAKPADIATAIAPITTRINSLEKNLAGVVQSEESRKSNAQRIVLALELGNLKRAMDRGQAFGPELAEVKRVAAGKLDLTPLERHKSEGVPTLGTLQKGFRSISFKIIDAAAMKENPTLVDQLLRGAKSMVRVRQVNHSPDDDSTEAIVGRMDLALKDGRLSDVIAEAGKLPEKAKAPARDWLEKVKARQSVDKAIAKIEASLKSSLSGKATAEKE